MRKKIFIIHGKGMVRGIGKEGGGDLDTVASNAFYLVWAENALREELGRAPEYGRDFEFDFINYSEGVGHLAVHAGCDIYIPDFPIDALPPRLKLLVVEEEETVPLLNQYTRELNEFRRWIMENAAAVSAEVKAVFNATYKQTAKVFGHQEREALRSALQVLKITRLFAELDAWYAKSGEAKYPEYIAGFMKGVLSHLTGPKLAQTKATLLVQMDDRNKEKMIDSLMEEEAILAFDTALRQDLSTRGRINYTDELLVVLMESVAYAVRGIKQLNELPWEDRPGSDYKLAMGAILDDLRRFMRTLVTLGSGLTLPDVPEVRDLVSGIVGVCGETLEMLQQVQNFIPAPPAPEKRCRITLMLVEEATGNPAPGIEVVFRRRRGRGRLILPDGSSVGEDQVAVKTDAEGVARVKYLPSASGEEFQFSVTYDDLQELFLPSAAPPPDEEFEAAYDEVEEEVIEEEFEEKEAAPAASAPQLDRAMQVSLAMLERHFRLLKENGIRVVSIDDHHPYTPAVLALLEKLKEEGIVQHIQIASLPRGEELPIAQQKCGSDLVYQDRIRGQPWDNPGLKELVRIAHLQDLHIEIEPLALELSKLIGSKFNKIEIARGLGERVKDYAGMRNIMASTGWGEVVKEYEAKLEKVYPRTEQNVGRLLFRRPGAPEQKVRILVALSPFCDAKKGEVQINVASAINYLMARKGNRSDYFFYCYGSQLMTTRRPNEQETSINLSTMCQHIGTRADGGHSGAATCRPSSNPTFPIRRLERVGDTNFLEFVSYLGKKVSEYSRLELEEVRETAFERYSEPIEKALRHVRKHVFEIVARSGDGTPVRVIFTRAPQINRKVGEEKPSFIQVLSYLKRHQSFDYLIFAQGMLYRVVLCRAGDQALLDLPVLARAIGWNGDGGDQVLATADIKKNKKVKKRLRRMLNPHLVQLASFMGRCVADSVGLKLETIRPLLIGGVEEDFAPVCSRMDENAYVIDLIREGGQSPASRLRVVAALAPPVEPAAGESEPSLPLVAAHFRSARPNYLIYSESALRFPREQAISVLMRVDDAAQTLDCSQAVSALVGKQFCGDDAVAEYMPAFLKDSPLGIRTLTAQNYRDFLGFVVPKMAPAAGYSVASIQPYVRKNKS